MDKVQNTLFLNYNRRIGKPLAYDPSGTNAGTYQSAGVHTFAEYLVPGSSGPTKSVLTSLANSIYIEARRHNMSLSPFGHLDPAKYVIAGIAPCLLLAEVKRDLGIVGTYEHANVDYGKLLAFAARFDLDDALTNYTKYCVAYNRIVAKLNALYIPVTGIINRWLEHRLVIFKDDEGDRYSHYLYNFGNYYELDLDPNSASVGSLLCKFLISCPQQAGDLYTLDDLLTLAEDLIDKYTGDDDMAQFVTEALQAGMPHISFEPLKYTTSKDGNPAFELLRVKEVYKLDDIMGLENAIMIAPVQGQVGLGTNLYNWHIFEHNDQLVVGTCQGVTNTLPVYIKQSFHTNNISTSPIFTHAKVTSDNGVSNLLRYFVGTGNTFNSQVTNTCWVDGMAKNLASSAVLAKVVTFGSELLGGCRVYYYGSTGSIVENGLGETCLGRTVESSTDVVNVFSISKGFKARWYFFDPDSFEWILPDYDYITFISQDNLDQFFFTNAWNDLQLVGSIDSTSKFGDSDKSKSKTPKK